MRNVGLQTENDTVMLRLVAELYSILTCIIVLTVFLK